MAHRTTDAPSSENPLVSIRNSRSFHFFVSVRYRTAASSIRGSPTSCNRTESLILHLRESTLRIGNRSPALMRFNDARHLGYYTREIAITRTRLWSVAFSERVGVGVEPSHDLLVRRTGWPRFSEVVEAIARTTGYSNHSQAAREPVPDDPSSLLL